MHVTKLTKPLETAVLGKARLWLLPFAAPPVLADPGAVGEPFQKLASHVGVHLPAEGLPPWERPSACKICRELWLHFWINRFGTRWLCLVFWSPLVWLLLGVGHLVLPQH